MKTYEENPTFWLRAAKALAKEYHEGQQRRGGEPYITHVEAVANLVQQAGHDETAQAVAWLHDILEDTQMTYRGLRWLGFPKAVLDAVAALTKRGESYVDYLNLVKEIPLARTVKHWDITHNLACQPTPETRVKYEVALKFLNYQHP